MKLIIVTYLFNNADRKLLDLIYKYIWHIKLIIVTYLFNNADRRYLDLIYKHTLHIEVIIVTYLFNKQKNNNYLFIAHKQITTEMYILGGYIVQNNR